MKEVLEKNNSLEIKQANISLILDSYNEIFSDFDPRNYSQRALSDDFLLECKRAVREKNAGNFELRILIPKKIRVNKEEEVIKKRVKEYFKKHLEIESKNILKIKKDGFRWFLIGTLIMVLDTLLVAYTTKNFFINFLIIILEPAGWFSFWEGLGKIFIHSKEKFPEYDFYKKMSTSKIYFVSY